MPLLPLLLLLLLLPLSSLSSPPPLSTVLSKQFSSAQNELTEATWTRIVEHEWRAATARRTEEGGTRAAGVAVVLCSSERSDASPLDGSMRAASLEAFIGKFDKRVVHNDGDETCWKTWMEGEAVERAASLPHTTLHPFSHALRLPSSLLHSTVGVPTVTPSLDDGTHDSVSAISSHSPTLTLSYCPGSAPTPSSRAALLAEAEGGARGVFESGEAHGEARDRFFWTANGNEHYRRVLEESAASSASSASLPSLPSLPSLSTVAAYASRYVDALTSTASPEASSACLASLFHLSFSTDSTDSERNSSSTGSSNVSVPPVPFYVHVSNVDAFHSAVAASSSSPLADACYLTLVAYLSSSLPAVCHVSNRPLAVLKNTNAQWIAQSGESEERPLWDAGIEGEGQIIAVSDSGLAQDSCYFTDFSGNLGPTTSSASFDLAKRKVVQYFKYRYADYGDEEWGHGTHVVGSAVGHKTTSGWNNGEEDGFADGVARNAKVAFYDIGSSDGTLRTPSSGSALFDPGYTAGARIHSASWGFPYAPPTSVGGIPQSSVYSVEEEMFDEYINTKEDFLILVAAGNDGAFEGNFGTQRSVSSPANAKNVVSVGASCNDGSSSLWGLMNKDQLADFSSRGPTADGRRKPDVVAPGMGILSAAARNGQTGECDGAQSPGPRTEYEPIVERPENSGIFYHDQPETQGVLFMSGTSMATPIVSGATALVRQYFTSGFYPTGKAQIFDRILAPSGSLLKAVLINSGTDLTEVANGAYQNGKARGWFTDTDVYDDNQGFGRITLDRALKLDGKNDISTFVIDNIPLGSFEENAVDFTITGCSDADDLTVTLVWSDPAASVGCTKCLINDLDLTLQKRSEAASSMNAWNGVEWTEWTDLVHPNGETSPDRRNNAERVRIANPSIGAVYRAVVRATNLGEGPSQKFSLVASGCFTAVDNGVANAFTESPTQAPTLTPGNTRSPTPAPTPAATDPSQNPSDFCEMYVEYEDLKLSTKDVSVEDFNDGNQGWGEIFHAAVAAVAGEFVPDASYVCYTVAELFDQEVVEQDPFQVEQDGGGGGLGFRRMLEKAQRSLLLFSSFRGAGGAGGGTEEEERRLKERRLNVATLSVAFTVTVRVDGITDCNPSDNDPGKRMMGAAFSETIENIHDAVIGEALREALEKGGYALAAVDGGIMLPTFPFNTYFLGGKARNDDRHCTNWKTKQWLKENNGEILGGIAAGLFVCCLCCGVAVSWCHGSKKRAGADERQNENSWNKNSVQMSTVHEIKRSPMHDGGGGGGHGAAGGAGGGGPSAPPLPSDTAWF